MTTDSTWVEKLKNAKIEYLNLDQWTAQKSRFIAKGTDGTDYAVALKRHSQIENGDILEYDAAQNKAVVIRIELKPVMVVDLQQIVRKIRKRSYVSASNWDMPSGISIGRQ